MTIGLCAELHEFVNSDSKVHERDLYVHCLCDVCMRARRWCLCTSNCESLFTYTLYHTLFQFVYAVYCLQYNLCFIDISVLLSWGWKDTCTNITHGDLEGRDPAARMVGGDWGVRACGLIPSTVPLWGFGPCGLNTYIYIYRHKHTHTHTHTPCIIP